MADSRDSSKDEKKVEKAVKQEAVKRVPRTDPDALSKIRKRTGRG